MTKIITRQLKSSVAKIELEDMERTWRTFTFKSVSMREPGRIRQGVINGVSPIFLKFGTKVGFGELVSLAKF